jgi:hypothetical protein
MPALRRPHTLRGPCTPARRRTSTRKDEDDEARVQKFKDCVVAFDELVQMRKELGGSLHLTLCVLLLTVPTCRRPLIRPVPDGL